MARLTEDQIEAAKTRWDVIAAAVPLKRRGRELVGLCPLHAEKSPSFYVVPDKGFAKCFGCGWCGDVISFVQATRGLQFVDAVSEILGLPQQAPKIDRASAPRAPVDDAEKRKELEEVLAGCGPITPTTGAHMYLRSRGLPATQPGLLAHPSLLYAEEASGPGAEAPPWRRWQSRDGSWFRGRKFAALVAPITNSRDEVTAALRIWVADTWDPATAKDARAPVATRKKGVGVMGDGAIRLTPIGEIAETLGLAEGPETGCAARHLYRVPTWAASGTARFGYPGHWRLRHTPNGERPELWFPPMRPPQEADAIWLGERPPSIWIPEWVERVRVFGDNGDTGEIIAEYVTDYWRRQGLDAEPVFPDPRFSDFNDELLGRAS